LAVDPVTPASTGPAGPAGPVGPVGPGGDRFDEMYRSAGGDADAVPWQHAVSRQVMAQWMGGVDPHGFTRAVVVAAGLGDDAAALADAAGAVGANLDVTAFDRSPTAVQWAARRHRGVPVHWHRADLFDLPAAWHGAFDLVVEVFTIQSVDPDLQPQAVDAVRWLLAAGGTLVAVALVASGSEPVNGPPWPLSPATLDRLGAGLAVGWQLQLGDAPVVCVGRQWRRPG
jgi:hypothetical protein